MLRFFFLTDCIYKYYYYIFFVVSTLYVKFCKILWNRKQDLIKPKILEKVIHLSLLLSNFNENLKDISVCQRQLIINFFEIQCFRSWIILFKSFHPKMQTHRQINIFLKIVKIFRTSQYMQNFKNWQSLSFYEINVYSIIYIEESKNSIL